MTVQHAIHHVGFSVENLDRSIEFYNAAFGLEVVDRCIFSGPELSEVVNVPNATLEYAFMAGQNVILELIEYKEPRGRAYDRRNNDVGTGHLCIVIDDLDEAYERLTKLGVQFNSPPRQAPPDPPFCSLKYTYCRDINGITIELYQPGTGDLSLPRLLAAGKRAMAAAG